MSNENLIPIKKLKPFGRFCCTIGNLPTSYMLSLTYEEQLLWLCDYLENTVIPAINNNAEAVSEIQDLFIKLKDFVDNYFNNLDVQEEINNKLDQMASDGTLESIINQEIFGKINNNIKDIYEKISLGINIFVGDSYGDENVIQNNWVSKIISMLGLTLNKNAFNACVGGAGFNSPSSTFINNLKNIENSIADKTKVHNIIVCGGYNDAGSTYEELSTSIQQFINYCKTTYPNAKIFIGMIGNDSRYVDTHYTWTLMRARLSQTVLPAYQNSTQFGAIYLNGVEYVMHQYNRFKEDGFHPNNSGTTKLAIAIYNSFLSGYYNETSLLLISVINTLNNEKITTLKFYQQMINNKVAYQLIGSFQPNLSNPNANLTCEISKQKVIDVFKIKQNYFIRQTSRFSYLDCGIDIVFTDNIIQHYTAFLFPSQTDEVFTLAFTPLYAGTIKQIFIRSVGQFEPIRF